MNKPAIIEIHTNVVNALGKHRAAHANSFGDFMNDEDKALDLTLQREISRLGQVHNPRISAKSLRSLGQS